MQISLQLLLVLRFLKIEVLFYVVWPPLLHVLAMIIVWLKKLIPDNTNLHWCVHRFYLLQLLDFSFLQETFSAVLWWRNIYCNKKEMSLLGSNKNAPHADAELNTHHKPAVNTSSLVANQSQVPVLTTISEVTWWCRLSILFNKSFISMSQSLISQCYFSFHMAD